MKINGTQIKLDKPCTLRTFLEEQGYQPQFVAVERNGAIVPKAQFDAVQVDDSDALEVVSFVGGG